MTHAYEINLSYHMSHHPEAAFLVDRWNENNILEG